MPTIQPHARIHLTHKRVPQNSTLPFITPNLAGKINTALQNSWAPSTLKTYRRAVAQFLHFCAREKIPQHLQTPTPEILLCAFAADNLGQTSGSAARNKIAALKAWHLTNNWPWNGSDRLSRVLNGVHNLTPASSIRPKRLPVSLQALETLTLYLNWSDPFDAAVIACACTAFWGQCRLGELLPSSSSHLSTHSLPSRNSLRHTTTNHSAWILHLPTTKTHRRGQEVALVHQRGPTSPICALQNHLLTNKGHRNSLLFTFNHHNTTRALTPKSFMERCNQIWKHTRYPLLTGHSFRIGGTTHLLISKVPPDVVKAMGRWSSDAFLRYWRSVDQIAPLYASNIHTVKTTTPHTSTQ